MVVTRNAMESRVENLERYVAEMRTEAQGQFDELRELLLERNRRRNRGRSPTPRQRRQSRGGGSRASESTHDRSRRESRVSTHSRERTNHHFRATTGRKVDIPLFNGDDAYGWIIKVERFFRLNQVREDEMVEMVMIAMEDRALNWFQWWEEQAPMRGWGPFKEALIRRFQPELVQNPFGPILNVKQKGSVMQYREQFEMVAAPMRNINHEMLKGVFMNGLKEEIKAELKLYSSEGLADLMDRALLLEEKNSAFKSGRVREEDKRGWKDKGGAVGRYYTNEGNNREKLPHVNMNHQTKVGVGGLESERRKQEKKWNGGQRLSQEELQERSKKGLCFKCGEKWGKDHICSMKNFQLILMEGIEDEEEEEVLEEEEEEVLLEGKTLQLSLNSKEGLTSNKSFKVKGRLENREVLILIDCGATSNFIAKELVEELQLPVWGTSEYVVEVGNGAREKNSGVCKNLKL